MNDAARILQDENGGRPPVQVWGTRGMVVAMHPIPAQVAADVLRDGGNAFDAAIALSAAISVVSPDWAGMAGDVVWLLHSANGGEHLQLDGYSTCPQTMLPSALAERFGLDFRTSPRAFAEEPPDARAVGIATSMVPGTPATWEVVARRFGSRPLAVLLDPAIRLASDGFAVNRYLAASFALASDKLSAHGSTCATLLVEPGRLPVEGDVLVQTDLASTFKEIARAGTDTFYRGALADAIATYASQCGGFISRDDLKRYRSVWRPTLSRVYRGMEVVTTGPPTAGAHLLQALRILEGFELPSLGYHSATSLHHLIEACKQALADRRALAGDPDFLQVSCDDLLADSRIADFRAVIRSGGVAELTALESLGASTTHFLVQDAAGNVVSATQTLGSRFGCGEVVAGTGLLMNDRSWWMALSQSPNAVAPGHRANIGHAPVILCKGGRTIAALGSPGGSGIVQYLVQIIVHMLDYGLDVQDAIEAPRFRLEGLARRVWMESRISLAVREKLGAMGYEIVPYPPWTDRMGGVEGLAVDARSGAILGGYDPRRNSSAVGLH